MSSRAPVMFIGHGSPMFAVEPGRAGELLAGYREHLKDLRAVLVISPHWMSRGLEVMTSVQPETVHDFGGFPDVLYRLQYNAPGSPAVAYEVASLLRSAGYTLSENPTRGRDHGAWVPMIHLLPDADIPVLQLSLDATMNSEELLNLGRSLQAIREQDVAIVASGSLTHNLYDLGGPQSEPLEYAEHLQQWIRDKVSDRDLQALATPQRYCADFKRAHPTAEHYLPLLIALGASDASDQLTILDGGVEYRAISMESYGWH